MALRSSSLWTLLLTSALSLGACDGSIEEPEEESPPVDPGGPVEPGEQARFRVTVTNNSAVHPFLSSGVVAVREGSSAPGPLFPGDAYKIRFAASPGDHLSLATMMVQSNDLFFSMGQWGIPLFDGAVARDSIELTSDIQIYDAGTEANRVGCLISRWTSRIHCRNAGVVVVHRDRNRIEVCIDFIRYSCRACGERIGNCQVTRADADRNKNTRTQQQYFSCH